MDQPDFMNTSRRTFSKMAAAGVAALCAGLPAWGGTPKPGEAFPDLSKEGLEGTLPELKGKVLLVDFWASWCGPCRKALPVLAALHKEYGPKGVVFVAVSLDEKKADMDAYLKKSPIPFTVVRDPKGKLAEKLDIQGIPTSFVVGKDGKVRGVHEGFEGEAKATRQYKTELDAALGAA